MIHGKDIPLRTVRATDLDRLYTLLTNIATRCDFAPLHIPSEPVFRQQFHHTGFWNEDDGRLLIVTITGEITGNIWCLKSIPYFDEHETAIRCLTTGGVDRV